MRVGWILRVCCVIALVASLCGTGGKARAQTVRHERGLSGGGSRAFRNAAEKQNVADWPIKSDGRPGTAVRFTFDYRNADINIVTDRGYGPDRLFATVRGLVRAMDLPKTDFIVGQDRDTDVSLDMEFNDYLTQPAPRVTTFDFDLSRFAAALEKTDLPRPIVLGVRANHSRLNQVTLATPPNGVRPLSGVVFLHLADVTPESRLRWRAEAHWSGYIVALLMGSALLVTPVTLFQSIFKASREKASTATTAATESPDPAEVQRRYDKSKPMIVFLLFIPLGMMLLMIGGNFSRAMESMLFLAGDLLLPVMFSVCVLAVVTTLVAPAIRRARERKNGTLAPPDPDEPPAWTRNAPLNAMMGVMLLVALLAFTMYQFGNPFRHMPREWRASAPVWLPIAFIVIGFLPVVIAAHLAARKTRRRLLPGDPWHDCVMTLGERAGVRIKRVVEVWSTSPNAYASLTGEVGLTRGLLHKMEPDEVKAVIAHEIGHHIGRHPRRSLLLFLILEYGLLGLWWGGVWFVGKRYHPSEEVMAMLYSPLFAIFIVPVLRAFLQSKSQHAQEHAADCFAVDATGDAELVIRALTRVHDLNAAPHRLKTADEAISTHPSLEKRIAAIREYAPTTSSP